MRPNLQLLLAYLDETLTPDAAAQAAACLEECEEAEALENRIRDVTRRLRLGAPELLGETPLDLNLASEFLDRTLPLEQAADIERECLDSDMLLAEMAACHQVLALALGEPARVPSATRRKLYALPEQFLPSPPPKANRTPRRRKGEAATAVAPPQASPAAPLAAEPAPAATVRQRTERWAKRWGAPTAMAALALCATALAWQHFWEPMLSDLRNPAGPLPTEESSDPHTSETPADTMGSRMALAERPIDTAPNSLVGAPPLAPNASETAPAAPWRTDDAPPPTAYEPAPQPTTQQAGQPVAPSYPGYPPAVNEAVAQRPFAPEPTPQNAPQNPAGPRTVGFEFEPGTPPAADYPNATGEPQRGLRPLTNLRPARSPYASQREEGPSLPPSPRTAAPRLPDPRVPDSRDVDPRNTDPRAMSLRPAVSPGANVAPADVLGRLMSTDQMVCIQGPRHETWQPLSSSMPLAAGDRLLSPPEFRPTLALGDMVVDLPPETMVEIEAADRDGVPRLRVLFGRVVVRGTQRSRGLWLAAGGWNAKLAFDGETGAVAIEVRPFRAPGADPEIAPEEQAIDLYAVQGRSFLDDGASLATCDAPLRSVVSPLPGEKVEPRADLPAWTHTPEAPVSEVLRARNLIANKLAPGESAVAAIKLAARDKQHPEVRHLAARWLGLTGEFDMLWQSLSDLEQRSPQREQSLRALRDGLARGPEWAVRVYEGCQAAYRDNAQERYRMLWGFTADQLQSGAAATLVAGLDHDDVGMRALAFWNLQAATGQSFLYRPEASAAQRRQSVDRWKARMLSE